MPLAVTTATSTRRLKWCVCVHVCVGVWTVCRVPCAGVRCGGGVAAPVGVPGVVVTLVVTLLPLQVSAELHDICNSLAEDDDGDDGDDD